MGKIKVWSRQDKRVVETLEKQGFYHCKPEYIENKMENFADYYKKLYRWYVSRAERLVPRPDSSIQYPIWVSMDPEYQLLLVEDSVILEMEVEENLVVVTDPEKWGYVVNFFYLPLNQEDLSKHDAELDRYGISNEAALTMSHEGNFYPQLKRKIQNSWERLFQDYTISNYRQGTLWEIRKEWIVDIRVGEPAND
ncbi:MAG: hypothetical protein C0604_09045 [Clostridiales bacterium]|nr:MAG: hypothetical protein C0604_09045 [Clostridiales bacterium]